MTRQQLMGLATNVKHHRFAVFQRCTEPPSLSDLNANAPLPPLYLKAESLPGSGQVWVERQTIGTQMCIQGISGAIESFAR